MQNGLDTKIEKSRKQLKERKNRAKKIRGVKKVNLLSHIAITLVLFFLCDFFLRTWFHFVLQTKAGDAAKKKK